MPNPPRPIPNPVPFAPRPFGLLSVAALVDVGPFETGITWHAELCKFLAGSMDPCLDPEVYGWEDGVPAVVGETYGEGEDAVTHKITPYVDCGWAVSAPFTLHSRVEPGLTGSGALEEAEKRAIRHLTNTEPTFIEGVWADGGTGGSDSESAIPYGTIRPALVDPDTTVFSAYLPFSAGVPIGVGLLEQAVAGATGAIYGGTAVLYVGNAGLNLMADAGLVIRVGSQLQTPSGSLIAVASVFGTRGPDGSQGLPADGMWIYAGGGIAIIRGPIESNALIDPDTNRLTGTASRTYAIATEPCVGVYAMNVMPPEGATTPIEEG